MSGPWTMRESLMLAGAVLLSLTIAYYAGKRQGSFDEKMSSNKNQIHVADSVTRSDSAKVETVKKHAEILGTYRSHVREKVAVRGDTILAPDSVNPGKDSIIAVSPEVAQLIQADDSTIAALKNFVAAQNTEIADLRSGLALRDTRIKLLESQHNPRLSHGIQLGAGYCATALGNSPCIYAGYGFQVRLP